MGRILGGITDQSGGVVAGATVTIRDVQRGVSRTLTTDEAGEYNAPSLLPGTYTVRSEAKGFKTLERQNVLLQVGQDIRVDLTLQPGEQSQTITVTEQIPLMETTNATLGGTLSNETINELPLNGRNYQNLVVLRPGSMFYAGGGGWTQSTNGSHPEDNGYIVDGLTNDSPLTALTIINGAGVEGDAATILPIDAIQEFNVVENPPAQYGWKPGAIVNVGLKSGTNSLHGTAYAFGRSEAFDARNYFNPLPVGGNCLIFGPTPANLCDKTPVGLEQFGATVGGPIKKGKVFYFLGFEDERYTLGNIFPRSLPEVNPQATPDVRNSLPDAILDMEKTFGLTPSALSMHLTGCTQATPTATPVCTGGLFPTNNGTSPAVGLGYTSDFRSDNGLAKIDYHINDHNTLNGMYFISRGVITAQDPGTFTELQPYWLSHQINAPQVGGVNWTWTPNSRWVNEARFGVIYMNRETTTLDNNKPATQYGINTGVTDPFLNGFPLILIAGLSPLGGFPGWPIQFGPTRVIQGVDNVSYLHGKHAFKFGGEIHYNTATSGRFSYGKGVILFFPSGPGNPTPLEEFMSGTGGASKHLVGTSLLHLHTWQYAAFVQDDWRITPRLTLNLGLRYEYLTPLSEANNHLGNFDPNSTTGLVQVGQQISSPYNADHKDFGPRVGLAWDVTGKGTTVIHAGFSIVTDDGLPMFMFMANGGEQNDTTLGLGAIPTGAQIYSNGSLVTTLPGTIQYAANKAGGPPFQAAWQSQPGDGTGTPLFTTQPQCGDGVFGHFPCDILGVDRNFRNPYVSNWTFGVEHAFTNDLSLNVAYVGNHGSRLPGITDLNQPTPIAATATTPASIIPGKYSTKFPYLGFINWLSNLYTSNYNGLQVALTQRTSHGVSFVAGYTYSHALDGSSFNIDTPLPQDSRFPQRNYESSVFDIKHRFTFSLTYDLPGFKSPGQLLQGWALNSVVTVQTGAPWGVTDTSNNISGTNELTEHWDFIGSPSDFKSGNSSIPYCTAANPNVGADFSNPSTITCTQTIPAGSVNLASKTTAFANACFKAANSINAATVTSLNTFGCYAQGNSVMIPPEPGTFGTMSRNPFRDPGLRDWDLSVTKSWKFKERLTAQFRAELFNVLNHPNFANPYGGSNGFGNNDPSASTYFGCGCATPDQAAGNPVLGSGGNRAIQLGLKLLF
jgi:outer membrane receptor protein involved in Fe transport